jgi:hypothetical protein
MHESNNLPVAIDVPVMSQEVFAHKVGLTPDTVRGMVEKQSLPTVKKGRHRLINIAALTSDCLQEAISNSTRHK